MKVREYCGADLPAATALWNAVVAEGAYYPQTEPMGAEEAAAFFAGQSYTGVAEAPGGAVAGLYILHPNNVGRCGHIANASYAVDAAQRGQGNGRALVVHSLQTAVGLGFRIMQFNAVVAGNTGALRLYESLGFVRLGIIPGGFLLPNGSYTDIVPMYKTLV